MYIYIYIYIYIHKWFSNIKLNKSAIYISDTFINNCIFIYRKYKFNVNLY